MKRLLFLDLTIAVYSFQKNLSEQESKRVKGKT